MQRKEVLYQSISQSQKRVKKVISRSIIVDKLISDTKLREKGEKKNRKNDSENQKFHRTNVRFGSQITETGKQKNLTTHIDI